MAIKISGTTVIDDSRNITNIGNVDGRDVSADGTKLDGISTGATGDQTKADIDALNIDADKLDGEHGAYYTGYTDTAVANLVASAPGTLDTLNELADALGDDPNFATTVTNSIATKLPLAGGTMTGNLDVGGTVTADGLTVDGNTSLNTSSTLFANLNYSGSNLGKLSTDGVNVNIEANSNLLLKANSATRAKFDGNGDVSFYEDTGTTPKFFWDSSDERLGLGTGSPGYPLHVVDSGNIQLKLSSSGTNANSRMVFSPSDGDKDWNIGANDNGLFTLYDGTTNVLSVSSTGIDVTGKVGIGTDSPSGKTHSVAANNQVAVMAGGDVSDPLYPAFGFDGQIGSNGGRGAGMYLPSDSTLAFSTAGSERMRIDSSGNVGIGTDSPTDKLNISSGTNQIGLDTGDQATYGTLDLGHFTNGAFIGTQAGSNTVSNLLRLGTSGTERMRIDSSGNIGINDTAPSSLLQLTQTSDNSSGGLQIRNTADNNSIYIYQAGSVTTYDAGSSGQQAFKTANTERMRINGSGIDVTGNITVSGTVDGRDIATNIPASLGTAGQVLTVNSGATAGEWADAGGGGAICTTIYDVGSHTFVAPVDCTVVIQAVGGAGAGGGYSKDDTSGMEVAVCGGSGGGYTRKKVSLSAGDTLSITSGAGGATQFLNDNTSTFTNAGSATTVTGPNSLSLTANGGSGGSMKRVTSGNITFATTPTGGTASGGDVNNTGFAGTMVSNFSPPNGDAEIYIFPAGTFNSGFSGAVQTTQATYVRSNNGMTSTGTISSPDTTIAGSILYADINSRKGDGRGLMNGGSASYRVEGDPGYRGSGGGGAACISTDTEGGSRTVDTGAGGDGFVAITLIDISV